VAALERSFRPGRRLRAPLGDPPSPAGVAWGGGIPGFPDHRRPIV